MQHEILLTAPATDETLPAMKDRERLDPKVSKEQILAAAGRVALKVGLSNMTRDLVAAESGKAAGLVTHYFENMTKLKRCVVREAIKHERLEIVAQGLALRDAEALKAPEALRARAWATLVPK